MRRIAVGFLFVVALAALVLLGLNQRTDNASASHVIDTVDLVAIDADIDDNNDTVSENDDAHIGLVQPCISVPVSTTFDIDLVVDNVRPDTRIAGYQVDIDYNPAAITVNSVIDADAAGSGAAGSGKEVTIVSRTNSGGGLGFLSLSDTTTTPNSITVGTADSTADGFAHVAGVQGVPAMHEPGSAADGIDDDLFAGIDDADEASGDGVLARINVTSAAVAGTSPLTIPSTIGGGNPPNIDLKIVDGSGSDAAPGDDMIVEATQSAEIRVGSACPVATDIAVTSVQTTAPASAAINSPFSVDADVYVSWISGKDPVNVDTSIFLNAPPDCTVTSANPVVVQDTSISSGGSPVLIGSPSPSASWSISGCSNPSFHTFTTTATATIDDPGASTINPGDDTANEDNEDGAGPGTCTDTLDNGPDGFTDAADSDCGDTMSITASADVAVASVTVSGVDVDGDTTVDVPAPSDTAYDPTNSEDGAGAGTCGDFLDNGPDGFTDTADSDCYDSVDNDGDTQVDEEPFIDGVDDDGDTLVDEDTLAIQSGDGFDQDGDTVVDEDPVPGCDALNVIGSTGYDGADHGQCLRLVIDKALFNFGPDPATAAIIDTGTAIVPTGLPGPAGSVPANCTLTQSVAAGAVFLPVGGPTPVTEKWDLECGFSPFTNINDDPDATPDPLGGDKDIDEDPVSGVSEDVYHAEFAEDGFPFPGSCADAIDNGGGDGADAADAGLDCVEQGGVADIDEDPSFEVAAFAFVETASTLAANVHVSDGDAGNNTNVAIGATPALPPQTPSAIDIIDDGQSPGTTGTTFVLPAGTPPVDDDCLVTLPCEMEWYYAQPGGNPTQGSRLTVDNADAAFGGFGFDIANSYTGLTGDGIPGFGAAEVPGSGVSNGSTVARATFSIRLGFAPQCVQPGASAPIGGPLTLKDGALPGAGTTLSTIPEGPNFPSSGITGVADGTSTVGTVDSAGTFAAYTTFPGGNLQGMLVLVDASAIPDGIPETTRTIVTNTATTLTLSAALPVSAAGRLFHVPGQPAVASPLVWPQRLEFDPIVQGLDAAGAFLWARYVGFESVTGTPINVLVFYTGPGGWEHIGVLGDPSQPSGLVTCTPYLTDVDYLGETTDALGIDHDGDTTPTELLRACASSGIGSHTFNNTFVRSDTGYSKVITDPQTCSGNNDISVVKSDDPTIGDDSPPGDRVHVSIPTTRDISITVTNGQVPADIDVSVSIVFTGTTSPPECDVLLDPAGTYGGPGSQATVGNQSISTLTWREFGFAAFEVRPLTLQYQIHCSTPVNLADAIQIVVNLSSFVQGQQIPLPDNNTDNNQAENKVDVISDDDYDNDTVPTPTDNCPDVPNPDQTDTDGDGIGDACDDDDDGDGFDDPNDPCPLVAEDPDNIDNDGCPDTDVSVEKTTDEDYDVDVSVDVVKTVDITVTNGNYPADVLVHILAVSPLGQCEVRMNPQAGYTLTQFTTDESPPPGDDTLWSQLERTVALGAGGVFNDTVSYTVHCFQRSQHSVEIQVDAVPLPPVEEEDVENLPNVEKNFPTIRAWDNADLKKVSTTVTAPPAADVGEMFPVSASSVIHNNGPVVADATVTNTLQLPPDCVAIEPLVQSNDFPAVPVSVPTNIGGPVWTVSCNLTSDHTFTVLDSIELTAGQLHVKDPNGNNNESSDSATTEVFGVAIADVASSIPVDLPATVDVSTDYAIQYRGTVTNQAGSQGPVSGQLSVSASITPAGDCTVVPASGGPVAVGPIAPSGSASLTVNATVHCTKPSNHTLTVDANFVATPDVHLDITVNDGPNSTDPFTSLAYADLKISSAVGAGQDDLPTAGTQVLVGPLTPLGSVVIDIDETVHNNGPYGPVDTTVTRTAAGSDADGDTVADCGASVAPPATPVVGLAVSVAQILDADVTGDWLDEKKPPYSCDITMTQEIGGLTPHIVDNNLANNSDTVTITLVRDTDGDTVPDNFDGDRDNCQDVPNPGQEDADGDGLGDACDPNPTRDVGIVCDVLLGPAAVNLSDTNGRYGWLVCEASNNDPHSQVVTLSVQLSTPPADCSQADALILPGQATFVLTGNETKFIVERIRIECHAVGQTPPGTATPGVYDLTITKCLDSQKVNSDDDGDTTSDEDPIDGIDNDGDSLIDEDPPEGNDVDPSNDCDTISKPVVIEQP